MKAKRSPHQEWLNNYSKASKWAKQYSILKDMKQGGGIAFYRNFFPEAVAQGIMQDLLATDSSAWLPTEADQDYTQNNISHSFMSTKKAKGLDAVSRVLSLLLPESLHVFSAAKYTQSDHIERHDDRAYTDVLMEDGNIICCSRDIAVIVYFTPNWTREQGGILLDLEAPPGRQKEYVPQFNSAVVFRIPRWHAVTPVSPTNKQPRMTVFGWFLIPGKKYPLLTQPEPPQQQAPAPAAVDKQKKGRHKAGKHMAQQAVNGLGEEPPQGPSSSENGARQAQHGNGTQQPSHGEGGVLPQGKKASKRARTGDAGQAANGSGKGKEETKKKRGSDGEEPAWRPGDGSILRLVPKSR